MRLEILQTLLERASAEPLGLAIETNNVQRLVTLLHEAKDGVPNLSVIICIPSIPNTVFLVQRSVELDP
jgi:hypothetical protein